MNKEHKIEQILKSMEGHKPASPAVDLFEKIEARINQKHNSIPLFKVKIAAAAAIFLLCINVTALLTSTINSPSAIEQSNGFNNIQLMDNYNIYAE